MPKTDNAAFAARIRERYPEGLTAIIAVGGTRTTYILEENRSKPDPGHIDNFSEYAAYLLGRYFQQAVDFFELGGQNLIMPVLAYQRFYDKGEQYAEYMAKLCLRLTDTESQQYYHEHDIDPYFAGIDTLLRLPTDKAGYQLAVALQDFQKQWGYREGRPKLIWEIAPIPLYSFWKAHEVLGEQAQAELEEAMAAAKDLYAVHDLLYAYYARAAYGTELPVPHFYLGSNRNGDLKLRSMLPIAMLCGGGFRLFYTPYPSLFTTRETLQAILEDLAFGKPLTSTKADYSGQLPSELAEAEYQRIVELSASPDNVLGFTRSIESDPT